MQAHFIYISFVNLFRKEFIYSFLGYEFYKPLNSFFTFRLGIV